MSVPETRRLRPVRGARPPEIVFDRVHKFTADGAPLLSDVSFSVDSNAHVAIVGAVGSGKTTILDLMAGLDLPDKGSVFVDGVSVEVFDYEDLREHRMRTGYVFGDRGLLANLPLFENVALPLRYHYGAVLGEEAICDRVRSVLAELEIEGFSTLMPARANQSVRKRALLARALLLEPMLLLFDEPQAGLVPAEQELVRRACEGRRAARGMTIVQADHDGTFGPLRPERVILIDSGRVKAIAGPDECGG
jgi:phospholipid/cholesterol/gamma-HCH transport system ATP-binding protein